jgi:hypothetical protein
VGVGVGLEVGLGVGLLVDVEVALVVSVWVGLEVDVGVGLAVGTGVGVAVGNRVAELVLLVATSTMSSLCIARCSFSGTRIVSIRSVSAWNRESFDMIAFCTQSI